MRSVAFQVPRIAHGVPLPPPVPSALPLIDQHRRDIWARMRAEKHPFMQYALDSAAKTGTANQVYGDVGQYGAIYYQVTGDPRYVQASYDRIMARLTSTLNANEEREYFGEYVILYAWIRDQLSADQRAAMEAQLKRWADWSVGLSGVAFAGGFPLGNTDQTIGQYFGLQLCDLILGTNYGNAQIYTPLSAGPQIRPGVTVGGLDATGANLTTTARNAIAYYCQRSADGLWLTWSSEYDPGDLDLIFVYSRAVNGMVGRDCFPELTAIVPALVNQVQYDLTPDLASNYEHGDDEQPRNVFWWNMMRWLCVLEGSAPKNGYLANAIKNAKPTGFIGGIWRALYTYDPYAAPDPPVELRGCDWNPSLGDIRFRNPDTDTLFAARFPLQAYVDHQYHVGDFQLYANGEWKVTRPMGYGTPPMACNSTLLFGMPSMDARAVLAHGDGSDYCWMTGATQGGFYPVGAYSPPPAFVRQWNQTTIYLEPGIIITRDVVDMDDPNLLPKFANYRAPEQAIINGAAAPIQVHRHCPVAPTIAGNAATWTTKSGTPVTLSMLSADPFVLNMIDETAAWPTVNSLIASEKKFHVRVESQALKTSIVTVVCVGQALPVSMAGNVLTVGNRSVTFNPDWSVTL